ncbi:hypothetical protein [Proteiniborus sp. MB09-C3]|uniref:hypothetical protein n=1 Tax=Proteiniborus sp. MB09-C3 TaxID=3050072 RepID=UPI002554EA67|nr:hypothetical protein [Proteiniborus sp. MB09-C3]WIV12304.1 hypothetical protein QO263_00850 [Proteiniborus sp. MB09-C3]
MSAFMRKFVILEEQPDYYKKVQGLTPKGHMNIEVRDGRGKLTINVDNLKISPDEGKLYKACLVGESNKNYVDVDLGVIVLNDRGKGSIEWKFDPASVGGTSLSIEKFNNVLVKEIDMANENKEMIVPLSGYIYKKDGSLVKLMKKQCEKESFKKQEIQKQSIEEVHSEESKIHNEEILEEINPEEYLQQVEIEPEQIQEDTYIASVEEAIKEENIEEDSIGEEKTEDIQEEKQEELQEYMVTQDLDSNEFKPEEPRVEDLSFEDIIPLGFRFDELDLQNMDMEQKEQDYQEIQEIQKVQEVQEAQEIQETDEIEATQEIQEVQQSLEECETEIMQEELEILEEEIHEIQEEAQEEIQEQINSAEADWIDLEAREGMQDFMQNHQVTYNYGDYIDNTYGSKIYKIDEYMDTARNYSMQVANYTMDILKFFNKVEPFRENLRDCTWWRIEHNNEDIDRGFLPFYNYLVNVYYPYPLTSRTTTCQSMVEKYGHYIFGTVAKQEEIKYYVYGVPGKFTIADHPYNGATGFNTWLKDKNSEEDLGYWLIYIDALSGKIINPVNPTIPTK